MDLNSSQLKRGKSPTHTPIEYFIKKPYKNLSNVGLVSQFEVQPVTIDAENMKYKQS